MAKRKRFAKHIYDNATTCELCGSNDNVQIHHRDLDATNNSDDNAIALCDNCHKSIHRWQRKIESLALETKYHEFLTNAYAELLSNGGWPGDSSKNH